MITLLRHTVCTSREGSGYLMHQIKHSSPTMKQYKRNRYRCWNNWTKGRERGRGRREGGREGERERERGREREREGGRERERGRDRQTDGQRIENSIYIDLHILHSLIMIIFI